MEKDPEKMKEGLPPGPNGFFIHAVIVGEDERAVVYIVGRPNRAKLYPFLVKIKKQRGLKGPTIIYGID